MDIFDELKTWLIHRNPLWGLDFDGTLVELQSNPDAVRLSLQRELILRNFAARFDTAIISGRAQSDLLHHISLKNVHFIGNHGSEMLKRDGSLWNWQSSAWHSWRETKMKAVQELVKSHGGWIEDKAYGLTIHFRGAPDPAWWMNSAKSCLLDFLHPVADLLEGTMCWNVVPVGAPNKGTTALKLCRELGHDSIFFIGDEATDENVFRITEVPVFGIKVGHGVTAAKAHLNNPTEVIELLNRLTQGI